MMGVNMEVVFPVLLMSTLPCACHLSTELLYLGTVSHPHPQPGPTLRLLGINYQTDSHTERPMAAYGLFE